MRYGILFLLGTVTLAFQVAAQSVDVVRPEERQKARRAVVKEQEKRARQTSIIEFRGQQAFKEKELQTRSQRGDHYDRRFWVEPRARGRSRVLP